MSSTYYKYYYLPPSPWEPVPFYLRWRGKERRRISVDTYLLFVISTGYFKRIWDYR